MTDAGVNRTATLQSTFAQVELRPRPNPLILGSSLSTLPGLASPVMKPLDTWMEIVTPAKPYPTAAPGMQEHSMPILRSSVSEQKPSVPSKKRGLFEEIRGFKLKGEAAPTIAEGSEAHDNMMSPGLKMTQRRIYQNGFETPTPTKQFKVARRPILKSEALAFPSLSAANQPGESSANQASKAKLMWLGSFSDDGTGTGGCQNEHLDNVDDHANLVLASKSILLQEPNSAALSRKRKPIKAVRVSKL